MFLRIEGTELNAFEKEVYRYLGYDVCNQNGRVDEETKSLVSECIEEMKTELTPQAVWEVFDLKTEDGAEFEMSGCKSVSFADVTVFSDDLYKNLNGCDKVALLAATVGPRVDLLIKKYTRINIAKGAVMHAVGTMYIEEFVEVVNKQISLSAKKTKPRFSPGYGDVPLELQKEFFRLLPCSQKLGLTLMDSLIMSPEKSVTAFVGIEN